MAIGLRHDVHDGDRVLVLIDLDGRDLAAQDLGEDVVGIIGGHRSSIGS